MNDRSLLGQYAGFVSRAFGLAIDVAISTVTVSVISWFLITVLELFGIDVMNCSWDVSASWWTLSCALSSLGLVLFAALFFPVYLVLFWTLTGETPGMRLMGVRVVRSDGRRVSLWTAIKRLLGYFACFFTLGLGFLWVLLDNQRQGLHDILAGTVVIYAWDARLRGRFITRMQRTALRAKTTAQIARELGADAWAGKEYHTIILTSEQPHQLEQLCTELIAWHQKTPPQVLVAITLAKDETGKLRMTEVPEILPPTAAVLASNPTIPRQDDVRGEVFRVMNELPDNHSALLAVVDRPLVAQAVQLAPGAEVTVYKGGWAKSKTTVSLPAEPDVLAAQPAGMPEPAPPTVELAPPARRDTSDLATIHPESYDPGI
jgi:uncharacterized RDD family membrane protein YckC